MFLDFPTFSAEGSKIISIIANHKIQRISFVLDYVNFIKVVKSHMMRSIDIAKNFHLFSKRGKQSYWPS